MRIAGKLALSALFLGTAFACRTSQASLIAADSFITTATNSSGYISGNNLYGQAGIPYGFTGTWTDGNPNSGATAATVPSSTTFTPPSTEQYSTGGTAELFTDYNNSGSGIPRNTDHPLTPYTASTVYYMSGLIKAPATLNTGAKSFMGFTSDNTANATGLPASTAYGAVFGLDGANFAVWARSTAGTLIETTGSAISANSVNFFVAKLQFNTGGSAGQSQLSVWLNPSSTTNEAAMGAPSLQFETTALDATNDPLGYLNVGVVTSFTNATTGAFTDPALYDEARLTSDFSTAVSVPEPASIGLLAVFAAAGLVRRSKKP